MRIELIACQEQPINFFPELADALIGEMPGVEINLHYVPTALDIPLKAKLAGINSDLIVVSFLHEKDNKHVHLLLEKLIDVELEIATPIVKGVEETELDDIPDKGKLAEEKAKLAEKMSELIINIINFPEKFAPEFK